MSIKVSKNGFTRKMNDLTPLQKLPKNGGDWGKLIVAKGCKKLPKVQYIAQSGLTVSNDHHVDYSFSSFNRLYKIPIYQILSMQLHSAQFIRSLPQQKQLRPKFD